MGGCEQHVQTEGHHGAAASQYCNLAGGPGRNSFYAARCSRERTEAGLQRVMAERERTGLHSDEIPKAPAADTPASRTMAEQAKPTRSEWAALVARTRAATAEMVAARLQGPRKATLMRASTHRSMRKT